MPVPPYYHQKEEISYRSCVMQDLIINNGRKVTDNWALRLTDEVFKNEPNELQRLWHDKSLEAFSRKAKPIME